MAKKPRSTDEADEARTEEARKVAEEYADHQRQILQELRRELNGDHGEKPN